MEQDSDQIEKIKRRIKIISYLIIPILSVISYFTGKSAFGPEVGWVLVLVVITAYLTQLSDIRANMLLIYEDISSNSVNFQNVLQKPWIRIFRSLVSLWGLLLFRPIRFRMLAEETKKNPNLWAQASLYGKIILLFTANAIITGILFSGWKVYTFLFMFLLTFFSQLLIYGLISALSSTFFGYSKSADIGIVISLSGIWLLLAWALGYAWQNGDAALFLPMLLIGLINGSENGRYTKLVKVKDKSGPVSTVATFVILVMFIAGYFIWATESSTATWESDPNNTPLNYPVIEQLTSVFSAIITAISEMLSIEFLSITIVTASGTLAYGLVAAVALIAGTVFGLNGLLPFIVIAPIFYWGLYQLKYKNFENGYAWVKKALTLDEWRTYRFPGERSAFQIIQQRNPDKYSELVLSQFFTGRHNWALRTFSSQLLSSDHHQNIYMLMILLPYVEFSKNLTYHMPFQELEEQEYTDDILIAIREKKRDIFKELSSLSPYEKDHFDAVILKGFQSIIDLNQDEAQKVIDAACEVEGYFAIYKDDPLLLPIWRFAGLIRRALSYRDIEKIAETKSDWENLLRSIDGQKGYDSLLPFLHMLATLTNSLDHQEYNVRRKLAETAFTLLALRLRMGESNNPLLFGFPAVDQIIDHWDKLLLTRVRTDLRSSLASQHTA